MNPRHASLVISMAAAGAVATALPANAAAFKCRDGFQLVQGAYIATPYCQDDLLFRVARGYGVKTSAAAIRNNPNHKREVCRLVGRDIRVQLTCQEAGAYGRRGL